MVFCNTSISSIRSYMNELSTNIISVVCCGSEKDYDISMNDKLSTLSAKIESTETFNSAVNYYFSGSRIPVIQNDGETCRKTYDYIMLIDAKMNIFLKNIGIDLTSDEYLMNTLGDRFYETFTFITIGELFNLNRMAGINISLYGLNDDIVVGFFPYQRSEILSSEQDIINNVLLGFCNWLKTQIDVSKKEETKYIMSYQATFSNMKIAYKTMEVEILKN